MSNNKKAEIIENLFSMLVKNADYKSTHGKNLFQKNTLDLTEQALQLAITDFIVDTVLGK